MYQATAFIPDVLIYLSNLCRGYVQYIHTYVQDANFEIFHLMYVCTYEDYREIIVLSELSLLCSNVHMQGRPKAHVHTCMYNTYVVSSR